MGASQARLQAARPSATPFFVTGGTMRTDALSYVERDADRQLCEALSGMQFCYVLDTRQMGKSSLMARIAKKLREELGYTAVALDLTQFGQGITADQWYDAQINAIARRLNLEDALEDYLETVSGVGSLDRWRRALADVILPHVEGNLVIFVDEIDFVRVLPFSADEFFAGIRYFHNARAEEPRFKRLTFCLLGVAVPNDLIRNEEITPFNLGRRIAIQDFARKDLEVLRPGLHADLNRGGRLLDRIFHWTDGHPFLTQRLCEAVAQGGEAPDVDAVCRKLFFFEGSREQDDNLRFVSKRLLGPDVDPTAILDLYRRVYRGEVVHDSAEPLTEVLKLSGIAKLVDGRFRVRNEVYRQVFDERWIEENMPGDDYRLIW